MKKKKKRKSLKTLRQTIGNFLCFSIGEKHVLSLGMPPIISSNYIRKNSLATVTARGGILNSSKKYNYMLVEMANMLYDTGY